MIRLLTAFILSISPAFAGEVLDLHNGWVVIEHKSGDLEKVPRYPITNKFPNKRMDFIQTAVTWEIDQDLYIDTCLKVTCRVIQ